MKRRLLLGGIATVCILSTIPWLSIAPGRSAEQSRRTQAKAPSKHKPDPQENVKVLARSLTVPFTVLKGRLALCIVGAPSVPPSYQLYLVSSVPPTLPPELSKYKSGFATALLKIDTLDKLRGRIIIHTPSEALAFVRLRTSPVTCITFNTQESIQVEVIASDRVSPDLTFGDHDMAKEMRTCEPGVWAVVPPPWKPAGKKYAGLLAMCLPKENGFQVTRTLLVENFPYDRKEVQYFIRIVEWVGKDGQYVIKKQSVIPNPKGPISDWFLPFPY